MTSRDFQAVRNRGAEAVIILSPYQVKQTVFFVQNSLVYVGDLLSSRFPLGQDYEVKLQRSTLRNEAFWLNR